MDIAQMNWMAVIVGTLAAFFLGMVWFSPKMFGAIWSTGSHNIQPPSSPPVTAMFIQFLGTALLAIVVGMTETNEAIFTAIGAIFAVAFFVAGMDVFSQKSAKATIVDASYVIAAGALMIVAQGLL